MKWKDKLLRDLISHLKQDEEWKPYVAKLEKSASPVGIHLAVFTEPILTALLVGIKTIESRFSMNRIHPFGKVRTGDIIVVKKSGGPVVAFFVSGEIRSYSNLTPKKVDEIRSKYGMSLGLSESDAFWVEKRYAKYATLINIEGIKHLDSCQIEKKDRTSWVIITEGNSERLL
jgi:hypothetical protein